MTEQEPAFPEEVRRKSAHLLAGMVLLVGIAALACYGWLVVNDGHDPVSGISLYFILVIVLTFATAILEWTRHRWGEAFATAALLASFGLTLALVLSGIWYLVPFVGVSTIAAIFGLVDRFAVRDEARHAPKHH